jgi:hypothetical protein
MLFTHSNNVQVYVALGVTDMRKSINGLSMLVEEELGFDLFVLTFLIKPRWLSTSIELIGIGLVRWKNILERMDVKHNHGVVVAILSGF